MPLEYEAILDRAWQFRHDILRETGHEPTTFAVSHEEYRVLMRYRDGINVPDAYVPDLCVYVFGMEVVRPQNMIVDNSELASIFERAYAYRREVKQSMGVFPQTFLVSEREDRLLRQYFGGTGAPDDREELQLFGMTIRRPQRIAWYHRNLGMEHYRFAALDPCLVSLSVNTPVPSPETCRTDLPLQPCAEVVGPCGEVIWEMSTCAAWGHLDVTASLRHAIAERMEQEIAREYQRLSSPDYDLAGMASRMRASVVATFGVTASCQGRPDVPPMLDSETSSDEAWEAGVQAMIAEAKQRRQHERSR